ncbi:MAG: ABC transporter substrate-binding protein [Acidimicrobiales bacterium]
MKYSKRLATVGAVGVSLAALVAAFGTFAAGTSSGSPATARAAHSTYAPGGTLEVSMGSPPESLDPQSGYSSESQEADWLVYTPLVTYAHKSGLAGDTLIPGLATALPAVSDGGTVYTATLRKGLKYSNGVAVKASDFTYTIERDLKVGWGGDSFYTSNIVGAAAYQAGKSKTITGIVTNDATGQITIHLLAPYGAFDNVLAFPSSGLVPTGTAMTALSSAPPPGVGSYEITQVKPNVSFTLKKNPLFAGFHIPGIPTGYVDTVQVTIQTNANTEAQNVLDNTSDEFDWGDVLPPALVAQVETQAKNRYRPETLAATDYFWLNVHIAPFNNVLVREAANLAVSRVALQRLASGQITPTCYYLPPSIVGAASGPCPLGAPSGNGSFSASSLGSSADIALAQKLVKQAKLVGAPVSVWTENREPFESFGTYLNAQLNTIGLKSTLKVINSGVFDPTIGSAKVDPQAGWGEWSQDYPNPGDFYLVLDARSIEPVNNLNLGYIDDPHIQSTIIRLDKVQSSDLGSVASQWQALEKYVDSKDYQINFGYEVSPFFLSDRVDFATAVFQPVFGDDWSTFELKSS